MASNTLADGNRTLADRPEPARRQKRGPLLQTLHALASLKLTVALFALSLVLIFAGTLAQVNHDIWEVMNLYFRAWIAWIPFQVFFPPSFFPSKAMQSVPGGFYFPGGFLIGTTMAVNLLAAHGVRFTVQARGARLAAGLATVLLGVLLTWAVVLGGSDKEIVEGAQGINTTWLWAGVLAALGMLWLSVLYAIWEMTSERIWERRLLIAAGALVGVILGVLLYFGGAVMPDPSAMRILWQLVKATTAALVLLVGCILIFRKRAGIVLLHAGVGLMMANELVVYSLHAEGMMSLTEGQRTNYAEDVRAVELAVVSPAEKPEGGATVDESEGTLEDVTVVPGKELQNEQTISDPSLPFDIVPTKYFVNSTLHNVGPGADNPATAGAGLRLAPTEVRAGAGTDMKQKVDSAAAYVKLVSKDKGASLGTYLLSQELVPQKVEVDGKPYEIALRFKRYYKPYTVELEDVRRDNYKGSSTVRNFSSDVRILDPAHHVDRKVHIWMNNPLRYAGDTLYQSGYDAKNGSEFTALQVVKNVGWMIPYVACMIVAVGMLAHFSLALLRFLRRRDAEEDARELQVLVAIGALVPAAVLAILRGHRPKPKIPTQPINWKAGILPVVVVLALAGWLDRKAAVPTNKPDAFDFYHFGELPLVYQGRVKPFDTLARNSLLILSGKQTVRDVAPEHPAWKFWVVGKEHSAVEWLLDTVTHSKASFDYRIFLIRNPEVQKLFELEPRKGSCYSVSELRPHLEVFNAEIDTIDQFLKEAKQAGRNGNEELSIYQKKLLELERQLNHYSMLAQSLSEPPIRSAEDLQRLMLLEREIEEHEVPLVVPPQTAEDRWAFFPIAWLRMKIAEMKQQPANPAAVSLTTIFDAFEDGDAAAFNGAIKDYGERLAADSPADVNTKKLDYEAWFNHFEPFYWALYLDLTAFALVVASWFGKSRMLNRTAFWVLALTFAVHTLGLVSRIYISGRPPVTNLYSAAVFIGWGAMLFGLVLEIIYRLGIGNLIASVVAFATLLVAHMLASSGDTLIVLQAVLDTQFWLATHVVCVTLGYAATFVTGLLGIAYIAHAAFRRGSPEMSRTIARILYGTLCFGIFFSFVGTVLGGLWADDSWGRFWGWDPKENGALMIVVWNALVLHARWGAMVGDRGLAILSVWGNAVTAWSFFGVNELGVGLHSYGFTEGVTLGLGVFVVAQLAIIAFGLVDRARSLRAKPATA